MRLRNFVLTIGAVLGFAGGCFDPYANSVCATGSEDCGCTSGGACDAGLVCTAGVCVSTDSAETVGDGDGDGDGDPTTGDGDGDPTTGDGDGDPSTGDGDGDPTGDTDMDGVSDGSDNCPAIANPNQRDFDDNGVGNVCDEQVFATISGTLNTSMEIDAGVGGTCTVPTSLELTGGEIRIQLDDDAALAKLEIVQLDIANIVDEECDLLFPTVVSLDDPMITNSGSDFPVSVPHTPAAHDAGSIAGDVDVPHPMLLTAGARFTVNNNPEMSTDLLLDGALPIFTANISDSGATGTLAWADGQFILAADVVVADPLEIDLELRGLVGTIELMP